MKKLILFLLILIFGLSFTTSHVDAAFWSNWFKKDNTVNIVQIEQPIKKSLWTKIIDFFIKPETKSAKENQKNNEDNTKPKIPQLDVTETQNKIKNIEQIINGTYQGQKNLEFFFTQEELTKVVLPYINTQITKYNTTGGNIEINTITLNNHFIEINGNIEKPINGNVILEVSPSINNGKIKLNIDRAKFSGIPVAKTILNKVLESIKIKPDDITYHISHTNLTEITVTKNELNLKGLYTK